MADAKNAGSTSIPKPSTPPGDAAASQAPKGNPVFRMMGLPNFRFRLPSRNWMIFWTIIGSWTAAWYYDRYEKKKVQQKWTTLVKHLAQEPIAMNALPRKITVYLTAPPADGIMRSREHFHEYVKPILAASGVDWDAVEGRKEGDVRAQLAEKIRKLRKIKGEPTEKPIDQTDPELILAHERARMGVTKSPEIEGDLIIGRNTWKEYVRGLHEGWLGPLDAPKAQSEPSQDVEDGNGDGNLEVPPRDRPHDIGSIPSYAAEKMIERATPKYKEDAQEGSPNPLDTEATPGNTEELRKQDEEDKDDESIKPKKPKQPPPFISTPSYTTATLSANAPPEFTPATTIPCPHILGIRNTPIRMYRFLTRRHLADAVGREVAAAVLASSYRPYHQLDERGASSPFAEDAASPTASAFAADDDTPLHAAWEQQRLLEHEEREWHKSVRKERDPDKESVWLDPVVVDPRIGSRMRRFELSADEEARAERIRAGTEREKEKLSSDDMS